MKKNIVYAVTLVLPFVLFNVTQLCAQENMGMATGNYAGVSSVWYNPANIADSRYKFDINLIGINSYFNNNYLLVKNSALVRRLFYKDPYNSSFAAVKDDLLQEQLPASGKVYARTESNIHFPFSFMASTGKRSAIAITMNNRTINRVDSLNPDLASALFSELRDPSMYGKDMRIDSMRYNFLNWQEIGFTYSRVILNGDHNFLKLGVTLKWLGANAGAYIQTNNAVVNFKDSVTLSLNSPLIHYARSERADLGQFNRKDILNNVEDQAFGWDAGLVYEYRAKIKKFRYIDETLEEKQRRDLNKYMFRIGISVVDMGRFTFNKKPLTNDHSADILNWDFSGVKASSFSDFDTAYSKKINYLTGASNTFTYRLPAAVIANIDVHLFGGFYINAAAKAPLESFKKSADTYIAANKWVAITPRYESRFLGVYLPVTYANNRTNMGLTIKFGPVYFGSNNLAQILSNESSYEADYHAGLRLSVLYGKPSKLNKYVQGLINGTPNTQQQLDSLKREVEWLKHNLYDTSRVRPVQIFISNNGVSSTINATNTDSIVINNSAAKNQMYNEQAYSKQQEIVTDSLVRQLAEKNLELNRMNESAKANSKKSNQKSKGKKNQTDAVKVETNNEDLVKEMERIRKQMAIQNAALITGGTVAAVAIADKNKTSPGKADSTKKETLTISDTLAVKDIVPAGAMPPVVLRDTVYVHDTVNIKQEDLQDGTFIKLKQVQNFVPIYFSNGSAVITPNDKKRLIQLALDINKNKDWILEITGMTDAKGSVAVNRKIAAARINAVVAILLQNGVKETRFITRSKLAEMNNIPDTENPRRIQIKIFDKK